MNCVTCGIELNGGGFLTPSYIKDEEGKTIRKHVGPQCSKCSDKLFHGET